jgi:hypothetical protein
MGLLADLAAERRSAPPLVVTHAAAGARFTAIAGAPAGAEARPTVCGVAYTGASEADGVLDPCSAAESLAARLRGQSLGQIAARIVEQPEGVGIAALNALLAARRLAEGTEFGDDNGLDLIAHLSAGKRLAVVGAFPYLQAIRFAAAQSWVLELTPEGDQLPASAAPDVLPLADVVGITGSTLANGTLEELLALCRPDAFVAVIGPTTPLSPVLFDYGVDVLCGSLAVDPLLVVESVAGGSAGRIPGMRQVSLRR